jgi:dihydrofolate reductase
MSLEIAFVVAMTRTGVMGKNNALPWHLPEDLKHFKKVTMGNPIVMGRKTYESIGRPLPGRRNIVLSRQTDLDYAGVEVFASFAEALAELQKDANIREIDIIGGAEIFKQTINYATKLHITWIDKDFEGDVVFPVETLTGFRLGDSDVHTEHEIPHTFCTYFRNSPNED